MGMQLRRAKLLVRIWAHGFVDEFQQLRGLYIWIMEKENGNYYNWVV